MGVSLSNIFYKHITSQKVGHLEWEDVGYNNPASD